MKKNSLKKRFLVTFLSLILLSLGFIIMLAIRGIKRTGVQFAEQQGVPICELAVRMIDGDRYEKLAKSLDESDPYYNEISESLRALNDSVGAEYLYTITVGSDGVARYILDGSALPGTEDFSALGEEEDISEWSGIEKLSGVSEVVTGSLENAEDWGWMISSYKNIKNSKGQVVGFVGVDFDATELLSTVLKQSFLIGGVGLLLIVCLVVALLVFCRAIFAPVKKVCSAMNEIANGKADLTNRIEYTGKNEIGDLAESANSVIESMDNLVSELKQQTGILNQTGSELQEKMQRSVDQISLAAGGVNEIDSRISSQQSLLESINRGISVVEGGITTLDQNINSQNQAVQSSTSAIEQITSNIHSVNGSVDKIMEEYKNLVAQSSLGRQLQDGVSEQISRIALQSDSLNEANAAIAAIAEQTNLLAMNAAIEAAHAGEAGKGFAVVADEIRSLAETSATQSDEIGELLESISNSIKEIVESSKTSSQSFEMMESKITGLNQLMTEVRLGMQEESSGVDHIFNMMKSLDSTSQNMTESCQEMKKESETVFNRIAVLKKSTDQTHGRSQSVSENVKQMLELVQEAVQSSQQNSSAARNVFEMIDGFHVN